LIQKQYIIYWLISENFLADSDAESNIQRDAVHNQEKHDRQKGLTVAFDPSAGPPEEAASQSKVQSALMHNTHS